MAVSALVVTLPADLERRTDVMARLAADPRITIGEPVRERLPIVTETADARNSARLVERLEEIDGVRVDLVAVCFEEEL